MSKTLSNYGVFEGNCLVTVIAVFSEQILMGLLWMGQRFKKLLAQ